MKPSLGRPVLCASRTVFFTLAALAVWACKPEPVSDPLKSQRAPIEKAQGVEKTVQDGLDAQNRQENAAER